MFNDKQIELSNMLFERLKHRFSEVNLVDITESAENPNHIWVNLVMPDDEDREIELREMAGEISTDILLDYGYHITIISALVPDRSAA
ncbi:MAG: hypothetical protein GY842_07460 [bacterium]|nr:hypothetical protein [bacterium]